MTTSKKSTKKTKNSSITLTSSTVYYSLRIVQRFILLSLGLITILYWIELISVSVSSSYAADTSSKMLSSDLNDLISRSLSAISAVAMLVALVATGATAVLYLVPRVKRFEKRLIVDSVVFIAFCLLAVRLAESIVGFFLVKIG